MTKTAKLTKKRLDKLELLDYVYQVKVTDLLCLINFEDKLNELSKKKIRRNLNQQNEIKKLLKSQNILPKQIYYFNDLSIENVINFEGPSILFTGIKQVSFDCGGLIVLQHFNQNIYSLYDFQGNRLLNDYCSELNIGTNGLIEYRKEFYTNDYQEFDDMGEYFITEIFGLHYGVIQNGKFTEFSGSQKYNHFTFPNISERDKISFMNNWVKPKYTKSKLKKLTDNSDITNILSEDGTLIRYMSNTVRENEKYCKLSIEQNELAFTLIPEILQNDKSFVTKLYSSNKVPFKINRFFNPILKSDIDIQRIEKRKKKKEDDLENLEFRKLYPKIEILEGDLPF
jgi:hypothetical protein